MPNIPGENVPNSVTNDFKVYVGAWQASGFFLREIRSLKDLNTVIDTNTFTADLLLSGRIGARWWDVVNTQITSWYETSDGKSSAVRRKAELAEGVLYPVLRFGINNLKPGTLLWNGNEFSAQSTAGKAVKGRLTISNSVPCQIEVYNADSRIPSYICEYKYDSLTLNSSNHFPSTILRSRIVKGVKTPIWVAAIFEIEIAKEEAAMSRFEPDNFVNRHDAVNYIQTNGIEFKVTSNTLLKLPGIDLSPEMPASNTTKNARLLILGCLTMSGLIFIALFLWKKNKH